MPEARKVLPFNLSLGLLSYIFISFGYSIKDLIIYCSNKKIVNCVLGIVSVFIFLILAFYAHKTGMEGSYVSWSLFEFNYFLAFLLAIFGTLATIFVCLLIETCNH